MDHGLFTMSKFAGRQKSHKFRSTRRAAEGANMKKLLALFAGMLLYDTAIAQNDLFSFEFYQVFGIES